MMKLELLQVIGTIGTETWNMKNKYKIQHTKRVLYQNEFKFLCERVCGSGFVEKKQEIAIQCMPTYPCNNIII
jgi:hypothetical protein